MSTRHNVYEKEAWDDQTHAEHFDFLSTEPNWILKKHYESFGEGKLLKKWKPNNGRGVLFEIGCATGELYRYIHNYHRDLDYKGFDISQPAIERAKQKYPDGDFHKLISGLDEIVESFGQPEAVWCRDVVLHQKDPYLFLDKLIDLAKEALFVRLRTRDVGDTEFNTNISRQLHWDKHWVPYIVLNVNELIDKIEAHKDIKSLVIHRTYDVLGGHNYRLLPEDLYFTSTGTAETALFIQKGLRKSAPLDIVYKESSVLKDLNHSIPQRVIQKVVSVTYKLYKKYIY